MAYFRQLVDAVVTDDTVVEEAMTQISAAVANGVSWDDRPAAAIAEIFAANRRTKIEALKLLSDFVSLCGGDVPGAPRGS